MMTTAIGVDPGYWGGSSWQAVIDGPGWWDSHSASGTDTRDGSWSGNVDRRGFWNDIELRGTNDSWDGSFTATVDPPGFWDATEINGYRRSDGSVHATIDGPSWGDTSTLELGRVSQVGSFHGSIDVPWDLNIDVSGANRGDGTWALRLDNWAMSPVTIRGTGHASPGVISALVGAYLAIDTSDTWDQGDDEPGYQNDPWYNDPWYDGDWGSGSGDSDWPQDGGDGWHHPGDTPGYPGSDSDWESSGPGSDDSSWDTGGSPSDDGSSWGDSNSSNEDDDGSDWGSAFRTLRATRDAGADRGDRAR